MAVLVENFDKLNLNHKHFSLGEQLYSSHDSMDIIAEVRLFPLSPVFLTPFLFSPTQSTGKKVTLDKTAEFGAHGSVYDTVRSLPLLPIAIYPAFTLPASLSAGDLWRTL